MIDKLRAEFGIGSAVDITLGINGLAKIVLAHDSGARTEVYLHGGHITSWKNSAGEEILFLSSRSNFEPAQAIRGGIPIIFPQFGDGPLPKHGFARTQSWHMLRSELHDSGAVEVVLQLIENSETKALWPHQFSLLLGITLGAESLEVNMQIENTGDTPFDCQSVFHTYFKVADIKKTAVRGLEGVTFVDSLRNRIREVETRPAIQFSAETDRIYVNTPDQLYIDDEDFDRTIAIEKCDMPDVVVWNPWIDKSRSLSDFGDDEYNQMVCVETGCIETRPALSPGECWSGKTVYSFRRRRYGDLHPHHNKG